MDAFNNNDNNNININFDDDNTEGRFDELFERPVDDSGRTDMDYMRRAFELFEMIKQMPYVSEETISKVDRIFSYGGNLMTIGSDTIHPNVLAWYNRLSGEHLTF